MINIFKDPRFLILAATMLTFLYLASWLVGAAAELSVWMEEVQVNSYPGGY